MILANTTVSSESGYAQRITTANGHQLASDEPERRGGTNTGAAPFDLMLSAWARVRPSHCGCTPIGRSGQLGAIDVKLRLVKEGDAPMHIERKITLGETVNAEQQAKLLEIADKTPVTKALAPGVPIQTMFETSTHPAR